MKIGVIGIGEMGNYRAQMEREGHSVRVANSRGPEAVKQFADEIEADAADIYGAVEGADVVLLSMPFRAVAKLPNDLFNRAAKGVVIIDTGTITPMCATRTFRRSTPVCRKASGHRSSLAAHFKAFNSIMFHALSELGSPKARQTAGYPRRG